MMSIRRSYVYIFAATILIFSIIPICNGQTIADIVAGVTEALIGRIPDAIDYGASYSWKTKAIDEYNQEHFKLAIEECDKALKGNNRSADLYNIKGFCLFQLNKYKDAYSAFYTAKEIEPDNLMAWYGMAISQNGLKIYDEALDSINICLMIDSEKSYAWYAKSIFLENAGRHDEALYAYNKSLDTISQDENDWNWAIEKSEILLKDTKVEFQHKERVVEFEEAAEEVAFNVANLTNTTGVVEVLPFDEVAIEEVTVNATNLTNITEVIEVLPFEEVEIEEVAINLTNLTNTTEVIEVLPFEEVAIEEVAVNVTNLTNTTDAIAFKEDEYRVLV